ncbi:MAG: hypothetical protein DRJ49_02875 [Thermoprotei archaeon]|nr:MAG: hypothetical protein DRJ49_02875 [Thermoprotei archaeon]
MGMDVGKVSKGIKCSVVGCEKQAYKSVNMANIRQSEFNLPLNVSRTRAYLCKEHYRQFKRHTKKLKKFDKWRRMSLW